MSSTTTVMAWAPMIQGRRLPMEAIPKRSTTGPQRNLTAQGRLIMAITFPMSAVVKPWSARWFFRA